MAEQFHALLNGGWAETCPVQDRGLMYGDGVFRTLRLQGGRPLWWQDQYDKLADDCHRLGIPAPIESDWRGDVAQLATRLPDATVKLVATRGIGLRGYKAPVPATCNRIAMAFPPVEPAGMERSGIAARVCQLRLGSQPRLAGIKHLNRLENVLARMEWDDPAISEGLLLDEDDWVIGGTSSNLFILSGKTLFTPRLDRSGIAGVARARLIRSAGKRGFKVEIDGMTLDQVLAADAVFFSNSLTKLRWVKRLETRTWDMPESFYVLLECLDD
jgi:4-amino-4-deoxychorismate lyase